VASEPALTLDYLLTQVAANEGAFGNARELDLVWQTVEGWGEKRRGRLIRHSSRVAGVKPCVAGNCRWSRHVRRDGSLPVEVAAAVGIDLEWWAVVRVPAWQALLARARYLIAGGAYDPPCSSTPITWGRLKDHDFAVRRGLVRLHCTGTLNDGYAFPEVKP
jgi:hypothetical protein